MFSAPPHPTPPVNQEQAAGEVANDQGREDNTMLAHNIVPPPTTTLPNASENSRAAIETSSEPQLDAMETTSTTGAAAATLLQMTC